MRKTKTKISKSKTEEPAVLKRLYVVGIGASAGGLAAIEKLISKIELNDNLAYIIIQHLDPNKTSMMDVILSKQTPLRVKVAEDGELIEKNTIYLNPPNKYVTIEEKKLVLSGYDDIQHLSYSIDKLFSSLAFNLEEKSIGVVLSGTGSDGSIGIKDIKASGGLTIAQSVDQAKYNNMPQNAINTGFIDLILDAEEIADEIIEYLQNPFVRESDTSDLKEPTAAASYKKIFKIIQASTGHDFSLYKFSTIQRRVARRLIATKLLSYSDYVKYLTDEPAEIKRLFNDLLISVTGFFRDTEAFNYLKEEVIPKILFNNSGSTIRIWIPACATGEEAYSIAILMLEADRKLESKHSFQIFATDLDEKSIDFARKGFYPENISKTVSKTRLSNYFIKEGNGYRVKKEVREIIIFAEQNIIKDPPFSKLNMICCRNLLIYMSTELQRKVIAVFHFVLEQNGILFLGPSESIGDFRDKFRVLDVKWKIFEKPNAERKIFPILTQKAKGENITPQKIKYRDKMNKSNYKELAEKNILEKYSFPCVLVNSNFEIVYFYGDTEKYLTPPSGDANFNILKMIKNNILRNKLNSLLLKGVKNVENLESSEIELDQNGKKSRLKIVFKPLQTENNKTSLALIVFIEETVNPNDQAEKSRSKKSKSSELSFLESELQSAKESLQSTIEELEASNEELKSTNEELQSTNEELQSSNEELETSKEELQSTNEELSTTNSELQNKIEELSRANDDINNLLSNTEIETIFLDNNLHIKRFTPSAKKIYNLIQSDINRPISDITSNLNYENIFDDAKEVLDTLVRKEKEIKNHDGKWYSVRILPYRTTENIIDGIVLTFIDITEIKHAQKLKLFEVLFNDSNDAVILFQLDGRISHWNKGAEKMYGYNEKEAVGMLYEKLFSASRKKDLLKFISDLKKERSIQSFETQRLSKSGKKIEVSVTSTILTDDTGKYTGIAVTERDITNYKKIQIKYEQLVNKQKEK